MAGPVFTKIPRALGWSATISRRGVAGTIVQCYLDGVEWRLAFGIFCTGVYLDTSGAEPGLGIRLNFGITTLVGCHVAVSVTYCTIGP